jgi:hypothetical protein
MIQLHHQPCYHHHGHTIRKQRARHAGLHQHVLQGTNDNENNIVLGKTTSKTQPLRQVFPLLFDISTSTIKACIPPHNKIIHTVVVEV